MLHLNCSHSKTKNTFSNFVFDYVFWNFLNWNQHIAEEIYDKENLDVKMFMKDFKMSEVLEEVLAVMDGCGVGTSA